MFSYLEASFINQFPNIVSDFGQDLFELDDIYQYPTLVTERKPYTLWALKHSTKIFKLEPNNQWSIVKELPIKTL